MNLLLNEPESESEKFSLIAIYQLALDDGRMQLQNFTHRIEYSVDPLRYIPGRNPPARWSPKRNEWSDAKLRKSFSRSRSSWRRSSLEPGSELGLCCSDMLGTGECVPREMSESESVSVGESGASPRRGVSEVAPDPESGGWLCLEVE